MAPGSDGRPRAGLMDRRSPRLSSLPQTGRRQPVMSHDSPRPYTTPGAFRRAVTDRLRAIAEPHGPWPLADLQRQFAYDRLLSRLYLLDDGWVVKGATALLARRIAVRHTVDLDVYRAAERPQAEHDLRSSLALDAGDWFTFEA